MDNVIYRKATIDDDYGIRYVGAHSWKETYYVAIIDDKYYIIQNKI